MINPPSGTRVWLAAGVTDMRRGMDGLAALVESALTENPFSGHIFIFRGRRGDLIKLLWWTGRSSQGGATRRGGAAGHASLDTFFPRRKKVSRPPGRVPTIVSTQ